MSSNFQYCPVLFNIVQVAILDFCSSCCIVMSDAFTDIIKHSLKYSSIIVHWCACSCFSDFQPFQDEFWFTKNQSLSWQSEDKVWHVNVNISIGGNLGGHIVRYQPTLLNIAKLSFNFNYNLVESWDGYILNFPSQPPTHPDKNGMTSASTANFDNSFNFNF